MNLFVARHGQTDWNKKNLLMGSTDIGLNNTGIKQAEKLHEKIKSIKFDFIISSNLCRAFQTATIACCTDNIIKNKNLRERDYGDLEGTTPENIKQYWNISKNLGDYSVEPIKKFLDRIFDEMDIILKEYKNCTNILIITHHGVAMAIDAYFKNKYDYNFDNFELDNCNYKQYVIN